MHTEQKKSSPAFVDEKLLPGKVLRKAGDGMLNISLSKFRVYRCAIVVP